MGWICEVRGEGKEEAGLGIEWLELGRCYFCDESLLKKRNKMSSEWVTWVIDSWMDVPGVLEGWHPQVP